VDLSPSPSKIASTSQHVAQSSWKQPTPIIILSSDPPEPKLSPFIAHLESDSDSDDDRSENDWVFDPIHMPLSGSPFLWILSLSELNMSSPIGPVSLISCHHFFLPPLSILTPSCIILSSESYWSIGPGFISLSVPYMYKALHGRRSKISFLLLVFAVRVQSCI